MFIGPECGGQLVLQQALQRGLLRRNILHCLVLSAKQRLLLVFIQRVLVFASVPVDRSKILMRRRKTWIGHFHLPEQAHSLFRVSRRHQQGALVRQNGLGRRIQLTGAFNLRQRILRAARPRLGRWRTRDGHGLDLDPVRVAELALGIGHIQKSPELCQRRGSMRLGQIRVEFHRFFCG